MSFLQGSSKVVERIMKECTWGTRRVAELSARQAASQAFLNACVSSEMPSPAAPNDITFKTNVVLVALLLFSPDFEVGEGGEAFLFRDTKWRCCFCFTFVELWRLYWMKTRTNRRETTRNVKKARENFVVFLGIDECGYSCA